MKKRMITLRSVKFSTSQKRGSVIHSSVVQYLPPCCNEMIFLCRTFSAEEAVQIGLINRMVPKAELRKETAKWCQQIKEYSGQTLRATKKSLNFESDVLYASWQQGMELLAEIWGSEESMEGRNAFLDKRKPDFHRFRLKRKEQVETYLDDLTHDLNRAPGK